MEYSYFSTDFDFNIGDVILIHKNAFSPYAKWNGFCNGRKIDGLIYCISGEATYIFESGEINLKKGEVLFLPANSYYTLLCNSEEAFVHYTANFEFELKTAQKSSFLYNIFEQKQYLKTNSSVEELYKSLFSNLIKIWHDKQNGYRVLARQLIYKILIHYFTDIQRYNGKYGDYSKLRPAIEYLNEQFFEDIKIKELAVLCNISETHFRRLFLKYTGMTPVDYRISRQLLLAKDLLLSGQYSVKEVAFTAGFSSSHYFSRVFTAKEGITPTEFIIKNQQS